MKRTLVTKTEFEAKTAELCLRVALSGERLVITDHGKPLLELQPYSGDKRVPSAILGAPLRWYDRPMDPVGEDDWEAFR